MKKNIIATINHLMEINNLVWIKRVHFQSWNQEQTTSCSWLVEDCYDYECDRNEYLSEGEFLNALNEEQLIFILSRICGLHIGRPLVSMYTDTFGPYAGLDEYRVHDTVECC